MAPETRFQTYQLVFQLRETTRLQIGKLGLFDFPAGFYIYTGSAKKNIQARVQRHVCREKKLRWHIDYLLAAPAVEMIDIYYYTEPECAIHQQSAGQILIPHFGASDCRNQCGSHLRFCGNQKPEKINCVLVEKSR